MGIYMLTCTPTGQMYIGSSVDVGERFYAHRGELRRGRHKNRLLQAAWNEHGEDALDFRIVEVVDHLARLRARENAWLRDVQPFDPVGFNNHRNARGRGFRFTPEQCANVSAALKGKPKSAAHRAAIAARPVHDAWRENGRLVGLASKGVPKSAEHRRKIGEPQRGSGNHRARLTEAQVIEIKRRLAAGGETLFAIGRDFGVHEVTIHNIKSGKRWAHVQIPS